MDKPDAIYSGLPQEVTQISHLIGIEPGVSKTEDVCQTFVHDRMTKKESDEDFKYKMYSLYETIDKNKASWKKRTGKCLNSKQKRALFDIKKEKFQFSDFAKINQLWHSYFDSVLSEVKNKADELKLARIDLHGAFVIVYASKNPSTVGLKGYIVQESKNTFRILNHKDRLQTIPKNDTVFAFEHKNRLYKVNGYNITMSSFNRSKIKPKFNYSCDL